MEPSGGNQRQSASTSSLQVLSNIYEENEEVSFSHVNVKKDRVVTNRKKKTSKSTYDALLTVLFGPPPSERGCHPTPINNRGPQKLQSQKILPERAKDVKRLEASGELRKPVVSSDLSKVRPKVSSWRQQKPHHDVVKKMSVIKVKYHKEVQFKSCSDAVSGGGGSGEPHVDFLPTHQSIEAQPQVKELKSFWDGILMTSRTASKSCQRISSDMSVQGSKAVNRESLAPGVVSEEHNLKPSQVIKQFKPAFFHTIQPSKGSSRSQKTQENFCKQSFKSNPSTEQPPVKAAVKFPLGLSRVGCKRVGLIEKFMRVRMKKRKRSGNQDSCRADVKSSNVISEDASVACLSLGSPHSVMIEFKINVKLLVVLAAILILGITHKLFIYK